MSSVVSSIVGGQAQNNVATTQQQASNYSVDVGARTAEDQQALSKALGEESIAEEKYGVDTEANTAQYTTDVGAKTAAEQLAEKAQEFGSTQDIASKQLATSAADINSATASAPSELLQEQSDIANKGTRSMQDISKQVGANLATSGVRGWTSGNTSKPCCRGSWSQRTGKYRSVTCGRCGTKKGGKDRI